MPPDTPHRPRSGRSDDAPSPDARQVLLERVASDAARHGLADRSLREIAESAGTSHRMLLYHFGSRNGLVGAIVDRVEAAERATFLRLARETTSAADLVRALWRDVSSPERQPSVRLFFEAVASSSPDDHRDRTAPWIETTESLSHVIGVSVDIDELRLGIAVVRGLLIDIVLTGDRAAADAAIERYITHHLAPTSQAASTDTDVRQRQQTNAV